jgi:hypothetical protein
MCIQYLKCTCDFTIGRTIAFVENWVYYIKGIQDNTINKHRNKNHNALILSCLWAIFMVVLTIAVRHKFNSTKIGRYKIFWK